MEACGHPAAIQKVVSVNTTSARPRSRCTTAVSFATRTLPSGFLESGGVSFQKEPETSQSPGRRAIPPLLPGAFQRGPDTLPSGPRPFPPVLREPTGRSLLTQRHSVGSMIAGMKLEHKRKALNGLKTVRGHLDAVILMVDEEKYCPETMKQVSALQGSLERVNRILLENHLETCVQDAIADGRTPEIVDELMETMRYTSALTGPTKEVKL